MAIDAGYDQHNNDPFMPGYCSSVTIGIADENEELIDLLIIKIWECERKIFGIPTSIKIPGSKIMGELLDETFEEIEVELKLYIEGFINE